MFNDTRKSFYESRLPEINYVLINHYFFLFSGTLPCDALISFVINGNNIKLLLSNKHKCKWCMDISTNDHVVMEFKVFSRDNSRTEYRCK